MARSLRQAALRTKLKRAAFLFKKRYQARHLIIHVWIRSWVPHYLSLCRLPLQEALSGASSHYLCLDPTARPSLSKFAHQETVEAEQMMGGAAPSVRVRVAGGGGGVDYESECGFPCDYHLIII